MRFNKWAVFTTVLLLPHVVYGATPGSSTITSSGSVLNIDPSKNFIGNSGDALTNTSGTIKALTYLSGGDDPASIGIRVINLMLGLLGLLSLLLMLYAGVIWFRSGENEEEVKKAKQIIAGSVIGLAITLGAYGIAFLLFTQIARVTGITPVTT